MEPQEALKYNFAMKPATASDAQVAHQMIIYKYYLHN